MDVTSALLDFGALGIFCAFLVYQHISMQKRLDRLSEEWSSSLEKVEESHVQAEESIRDRYDKILARYETTRESVYNDVVATLKENREVLDGIASKIEDMRRARLKIQQSGEWDLKK